MTSQPGLVKNKHVIWAPLAIAGDHRLWSFQNPCHCWTRTHWETTPWWLRIQSIILLHSWVLILTVRIPKLTIIILSCGQGTLFKLSTRCPTIYWIWDMKIISPYCLWGSNYTKLSIVLLQTLRFWMRISSVWSVWYHIPISTTDGLFSSQLQKR